MTKPRNQANMSNPSKENVDLQKRLEKELQKVQETTKSLENDRQLSSEILHETFTL